MSITLFMASPFPFFLSGSTSNDFEQTIGERNPLPPCPDSPNCVRISKAYQHKKEWVYKASESVIDDMDAVKMELLDEPLRLKAVFKVFIYKDDFTVLIEEADDSSCRVHIRSASRVGYSDLGVNRRRVKRFLRKLNKALGSEKAVGYRQ
jgi:uncharacterized protein (DUF1499 family)